MIKQAKNENKFSNLVLYYIVIIKENEKKLYANSTKPAAIGAKTCASKKSVWLKYITYFTRALKNRE